MRWWAIFHFGDLRKQKMLKLIKKAAIFFFFLKFSCFWKSSDVVMDVLKNISAWPGRHLLDGGEHRRYFALKTVARGVIEFECRNQREYDIWTQGVSRLLTIAADKNRHRM